MSASVALAHVIATLDAELRTPDIADYPGAMNGLQIANGGHVTRVATAVDASSDAIRSAIATHADLLIVHHGLFWSGAQPLVGVTYEKYRLLLTRGVAVYASHLPLDVHPIHGNNARLAAASGLTVSSGFAPFKGTSIGVAGLANEPTANIAARVQSAVAPYGGVVRTSMSPHDRVTRNWAMCTGGGASSETLREAALRGIDTLIVGEGPHHTTVDAIERNICVIFAGHYATETLGVQSLGAFLHDRFALPHSFLHLPTGS